jgi:hypothetical protein
LTFHIYSHSEQKLKRNPDKWEPLIQQKKGELGELYNIATLLNNMADKLANKAREDNLLSIEKRVQFFQDNTTVYKIQGTITPDSPRRILKQKYYQSFPKSPIYFDRKVHLSQAPWTLLLPYQINT